MFTKNLERHQKESIILLSTGTFLEYFDLMLYVHMAILLNDLFFPKTDSHMTALISSFVYCSTFVVRPFGALLLGWLGDNIGRKSTIILTTFMMALACFIMATLPTYAQIGITATYLMILCRMLQGISSMGERLGAEIYLTETIDSPMQYPAVALVSVFSAIGTALALGITSLFASDGYNWRYAFWFGLIIGLIGVAARTRLREAPEFIQSNKLKQKQGRDDLRTGQNTKEYQQPQKQVSNKKTIISLFLMQCYTPIGMYVVYIHCANVLKTFGLTASQIIDQNFIVSIIDLAGITAIMFLTYYVNPLKILWTQVALFIVLFPINIYLLYMAQNASDVFVVQVMLSIVYIGVFPAMPIFLKHLPLLKRFTMAGMIFALSRTLMYILTSFGIVYLVEYCGQLGLLVIFILTITYVYGLYHFAKLEKEYVNSIL
jgi:MFS family permease